MSDRNYDYSHLVVLPRVDILGAVALAESLDTAAADVETNGPMPGALPSSISEGRADMQAQKDEAKKAIAALGVKPNLTLRDIDIYTDLIYRAQRQIAGGWALLAEYLPQGKEAQRFLDQMYADGLKATQLRGVEQWTTLESRIGAAKASGVDQVPGTLGAQAVWNLFLSAQESYGKVVGTTEVSQESPQVAKAREDLQDAMRYYVLQVSASVKKADAGTQARAEALLKPLMEWKSAKSGGEGKSEKKDEPAGPPVT